MVFIVVYPAFDAAVGISSGLICRTLSTADGCAPGNVLGTCDSIDGDYRLRIVGSSRWCPRRLAFRRSGAGIAGLIASRTPESASETRFPNPPSTLLVALPPRLFPATDAEVESVTLSDALKCSLGIPPGAIPKCWLWGSHHANSNAAGFDLSQGIMNEGVAFYLVFDRRDVVWFNREFAATA